MDGETEPGRVESTVPAPGRLAGLHVDALFRTTPDGALVETNEPSPATAPRVFVARTSQGVICRLRHDVPAPLAARLRQIAAGMPPLPEQRAEVTAYDDLRDAVEEAGAVEHVWHGPAYHFAAEPRPLDPDVEEITAGHSGLAGEFECFHQDLPAMAPFFGIIRAGAVVSGCFSARITTEAAEAGVMTDVAHRGQGLAAAAVNAWRLAIARSGRTPLYSTSYDNLSSQAVTRRLGLAQYAETFALT
ncbi:GNAT family N-acetyltransferase [Actinopolymorpha pittospori]